MSILKRTIFLSNHNEKNKYATLTLEKKTSGIFGQLKWYGEFHNNLILGLKTEDKIIKQNIILNDGIYDFKLNENINLENKIGCAILENKNGEYIPHVYSTEKGYDFKGQIINNLKSNIQKLTNIIPQNQILGSSTNTTSIELSHNDTNHISQNNDIKIINQEKQTSIQNENHINSMNENTMTENLSTASQLKENKEHSVQQNKFHTTIEESNIEEYSQISMHEEKHIADTEIATACSQYSQLFEYDENEIENTINNELLNKNGKSHKFFDMIAEQLEELFDTYPAEETLSTLINNSRWCKIKKDIDNKYYVVGIIYENDDIKYICYGVPGEYSNEPPNELKNYSQWLPTDITDPYNNGYWVMYQNADTGENIII